MAPRRKQAQEMQTNPAGSGSGSVQQPSSVSALVNSRTPNSAEKSSIVTRSRANTRKRSAETALDDSSRNNNIDNNSAVSATFTTAPTRKKQHTALTNTNTTTLAALKKRPQSKRQKTVSPNNSDDNNNICDDDGYNYDSEDGDGVQSRAFTAERRAAIARLAIQTGEDEEDEDGEDDDSRPRQRSKWTSGKGKQPIYRLSSEQMKSRRSTQQPSMQGEDDEYSSYPSSVLTPRDLQRRKRSSKKMMKEYLGDWEAFNEEKRAASALRRARRAEIAKWKKAFGEQGGGEKETRSSLNVSQDPFPEVKPRPTEAQYMKHIVGWKKYCIAHLDGDLTVTAAGVLDYIETEVFTDTVIKYIPQGTSYQGVLGLRQPHYNDPRSNAVRRRDNLDIIMTKSVDPSSELSKMLQWNSMKPPAGSNLDLVTWQISTALVETYPKDQAATSRIGTTESPDDPEAGPSRTSTRPQQDGARDGFGMEVIVCNGGVSMDDIGDDEDDEGDGSSDDESDIDMGDGGPAAMQRPISKYGQRRTTNGTLIPRVALIGSIIDQDNVLLNAPVDGKGRKVIEIPPAYGTTETALKALVFLWRLQKERTCLFANKEPSPRDDGLIRKAYKRYRERLVVSEEFKGSTRQGTCLVRDPYTERQFITMLAFTWRQQVPLPLPLESGVRRRNAYDNSSRFPHIREHFCLAARHSMVLRDEDLRHLNLADVFSIDRTRSVKGSKRAVGLCFCIHRGKTNGTGMKQYAAAFRHKNFLRCPVGAFAFYMLERFHINREPFPDFSNPGNWYDIKVLSSGGERHQLRALDLSTQIDSTKAVMRSCSVYSPKITHAGRHAGVAEAYALGCPIEEIRQLGRWVMTQMENYYLPSVPVNPAFYMAGFFAGEPFSIERDLIMPSVDLQREIFPWIEDSFAGDQSEPYWQETCRRVMNDEDPNKVTEADIYEKRVLPESAASNNCTTATANNDRVRFLTLLVQMRRVILQDAALYLRPNSKGETLQNTLLSLPVFSSSEFLAFQSQLLNALESSRLQANIISTNVVTDGPTLTAGINAIGTKLDQHMLQQGAKLAGMTDKVDKMEICFGQLAGVMGSLAVREKRTQIWLEEGIRIQDELVSAVDIPQYINTLPPLSANQQQQQLPSPLRRRPQNQLALQQQQQQQQQKQLRIQLLEQELHQLRQEEHHHQQHQPFLSQPPLIQHYLSEPQTESGYHSQVQVQAQLLSQELHPADVQPQQRLQYFHTHDHEHQRVQEQLQKRVLEENEREAVLKKQRDLSTGTPYMPFLPDNRQVGLTLGLAWLEYKHFSRTLLPEKEVARLGLPPWPGGLMRSQLQVKHEVALRRRTILFSRVERLARKEDQTFEAHVETLMDRYKGKTVSAIATILENLEMPELENVASPIAQPTKDKGKGKKDEDEDGEGGEGVEEPWG